MCIRDSYGIALGNIAMMIANTVGVIACTAAIAVSHYWRNGEAPEEG